MVGIVEDVRTLYTKTGEKMALIKMSDFSGSIEVALFPKRYKDFASFFTEGAILVIKGEITDRNDMRSVTVREAKKIEG